jgi:acetolactate synthase-1/3 small subunit
MYKLATDIVMQNPAISRLIRHHEGIIMEVNPTYVLAMKNGMTEDIMNLYYKLNEFGCVLQYTRSGRIAVTRSTQEEVSEFIEQREKNI